MQFGMLCMVTYMRNKKKKRTCTGTGAKRKETLHRKKPYQQSKNIQIVNESLHTYYLKYYWVLRRLYRVRENGCGIG